MILLLQNLLFLIPAIRLSEFYDKDNY